VPDPGEVPSELRLTVGARTEITLAGLGTAGYRWTHEVQGDDGVVELSWQRGVSPGEAVPRPVGASSPERLTVTGTAPGQVVLHLIHSRPWESGKPPRAQHTIGVQVAPA
jgi:predicted secreted protein